MNPPNEATIRLSIFLSVFAVMALWENLSARRSSRIPRGVRWQANLGLAVIDTACLQLVAVIAASGLAMGAAAWSQQRGIGLLNWVEIPALWASTIGVVLLDFGIYAQHWLSHKVPLFWRLHKVHHTDLELDVTSALRFHPAEIVLSMGFKMLLVLMLGVSPAAVLLFEILLNATALFNHANVYIPLALDRVLRCFLVTPDMHRVHHSCYQPETDSNYGSCLSCWDRILRTYQAQPAGGHESMVLGLETHRDPQQLGLWRLLPLPLL